MMEKMYRVDAEIMGRIVKGGRLFKSEDQARKMRDKMKKVYSENNFEVCVFITPVTFMEVQ